MMYSMPIWAPGDHAWVLSAVLPVSHATCKMLTRKKYIKWSDASCSCLPKDVVNYHINLFSNHVCSSRFHNHNSALHSWHPKSFDYYLEPSIVNLQAGHF